jgi:hypothetical protein
MAIAQQLSSQGVDARELLAKVGLEPVKVEIVKAEYGAGGTLKDVTKSLQQQVGDLPLISLPAPSYNESFGGDPAPNTPKHLTVHYKINGKSGDAQFSENAVIMLPMPE